MGTAFNDANHSAKEYVRGDAHNKRSRRIFLAAKARSRWDIPLFWVFNPKTKKHYVKELHPYS
jgi:hypothetical protein